MTIDLLKHNFQQLYLVAKKTVLNRHSLVANYSKTHIYDAAYCKGRFWRCFYQAVIPFTEWDYADRKLKKALINTQKIFQKELSLLEPHLENYQNYLKNAGNGYAVNELSYNTARKMISAWNGATWPFVKLLRTLPKDNFLLQLLQRTLNGATTETPSPPLFQTPLTTTLNICQKIIDLEGMTAGPLPLDLINKILLTKPLTESDVKSLEKWSKKINAIKAEKIQSVHKALQAITLLYQGQSDLLSVADANAAPIEILLENHGCTLFQQKDLAHMQWRDQLEAGSHIPSDTADIVLGREINPLPTPGDKTRVFNIEGQPHLVVLVGRNQAELSIRHQRQTTEKKFGIPLATIIKVIHGGRVALMDRLQPIANHQWTSQQGILSQSDEPLVTALVTLLQDFIQNKYTSSNFKPSTILLDSQYQLRTLKPMTKRRFDFNALEDFADKCAGNNETIFKHLMEASGLSTHDTAEFYYDMITMAFKGEVMATDDLAGVYKISDPKVVDRGDVLVEEALQLWRELCSEIHTLFPQRTRQELNQAVGNAFIACHRASKGASKLRPSLRNDIITKIKAIA